MEIKSNNYWRNRRVLVTGHQGFLGSWLTRTLIDLGASVVGVDKFGETNLILAKHISTMTSLKGDIAELKFVQKVINQYRPQIVFHLAAEAIVKEANKDPIRAFKSNIEGTWNILEACRGKDFIEGIVSASSDKAYGEHRILPYTEEAALQGEHPYDASKSCADLLCRTYFKTYNLPVCVTRCGNIYGPGDVHFSRIVPDAMQSILKGKQLVIRSDGKFTRDYVFVKDIVAGYILIAQNLKRLKLAGEAFNFSCEDPLSVLKLFETIAKVSAKGRKTIKPKILNQAKYEIHHQYLSAAKAKRILKWKSAYDLKKGLKETLSWYEQNLSKIKGKS